MSLGITRRRFLTVGAAAGAVLMSSRPPIRLTRAPRDELRVGELVGHEKELIQLRSRSDHTVQTVLISPDTQVTRNGPAALTDFTLGEEIIAFGRQGRSGFRAHSVDRLYRSFNGSLSFLDNSVVKVDGIAIAVTEHTAIVNPWDPSDKASTRDIDGRHVHALAWYRPIMGDLEGSRISLAGVADASP